MMRCSKASIDTMDKASMNRFIVALPQAAAIAIRPAKVLLVGLGLGALLTVSNFVQVANAQKPSTAREQALRECSLLERRDSHDPWEGTKTGSRQFVYKACMADRGRVD
jgi:hypothetical protein